MHRALLSIRIISCVLVINMPYAPHPVLCVTAIYFKTNTIHIIIDRAPSSTAPSRCVPINADLSHFVSDKACFICAFFFLHCKKHTKPIKKNKSQAYILNIYICIGPRAALLADAARSMCERSGIAWRRRPSRVVLHNRNIWGSVEEATDRGKNIVR